MTDRYRIQQGPDGRFRIVHPHDPDWVWSAGDCWSELRPLLFASQDEAEQYAKELFSQQEAQKASS